MSHEASFGKTVECVLFRACGNKYFDGVLISSVTWITMGTKVLDGVIDVHKTNQTLHVSSKNYWNTFKC